MVKPLRILSICGSAREGSWNQRLLNQAIAEAKHLGALVTTVELRSLNLPIYDEGLESDDLPCGAVSFRESLRAHDCLLIATPEYNASVPPLLKNALDWSSRPVDGRNGLEPWFGKVCAIMSASQGGFGGIRATQHLRDILTKMGALTIPQEVNVSHAQHVLPGTMPGEDTIQRLIKVQLNELIQTSGLLSTNANVL